jgi:hypothetical protein
MGTTSKGLEATEEYKGPNRYNSSSFFRFNLSRRQRQNPEEVGIFFFHTIILGVRLCVASDLKNSYTFSTMPSEVFDFASHSQMFYIYVVHNQLLTVDLADPKLHSTYPCKLQSPLLKMDAHISI